MIVLRPALFPQGKVLAALSTRGEPGEAGAMGMNLSFNVGDEVSAVRRNRGVFFGGLGIAEDELAIPRQVHGDSVLHVTRAGEYLETDGLITSNPRVFLCITFADCLPLLLYDPVKHNVAALHAGWRGTALNIVGSGIKKMQQAFGSNPDDLLVYLGPGAGPCCYEIGEDVARRFDPQFVRRGDKLTVDLKGALISQLLTAGCRKERLEVSASCTIHELQYHSFRRDGRQAGRMMACIGLLPRETEAANLR